MKNETFEYIYNNQKYNVFVTYKDVRNINYRIKNDGFYISAPFIVSKRKILDGLDKFAPKLIKSLNKNNSHYSFENDYVYLLGKKYSLIELGIYTEQKLNKFLKELALDRLTHLTRKYEEEMGIKKPYKIGVRNVSTRYGSNSYNTHSISYNVSLVHYSEEIMSTVVVHELAHEFHRNHQQGFYNCVYSYCPNYDFLQKKLKRGIHE